MRITDLMALLLFGIFAVCALFVILAGANLYQDLVTAGEQGHADRTVRQYVATRVRQAETVFVEDFCGCSALVSAEEIDGETYLTRVYCSEGYLRELFCEEGAALEPQDGEKILPLESASFDLKDGVLTAELGPCQVILTVRSGREILP